MKIASGKKTANVKKPDVVVINSYGGSLQVGARMAGLNVVLSMEDAAFGIDIQKMNYPSVEYVDRAPWPDRSLSGQVVLAHPPCAAFSNQNQSNDKRHRGSAAESFKCHVAVMEYSMRNGCSALAIESVPGALEGARETYDRVAKKYGYNVFRIMQNAVTFGVPQWRPRFWALFTKLPELWIEHKPEVRNLASVMLPSGTMLDGTETEQANLERKFKQNGFTTLGLFDLSMGEEGTGNLLHTYRKYVQGLDGDDVTLEECARRLGTSGTFFCKYPRRLDPEGFATTVLSDSNWWFMERSLYVEEYCGIMGFPVDYKWPEGKRRTFRTYLSKGVCPPVAAWVAGQLAANVENPVPKGNKLLTNKEMDAVFKSGTGHFLKAGEVLDLTVTKKQAEEIMKKQRRN